VGAGAEPHHGGDEHDFEGRLLRLRHLFGGNADRVVHVGSPVDSAGAECDGAVHGAGGHGESAAERDGDRHDSNGAGWWCGGDGERGRDGVHDGPGAGDDEHAEPGDAWGDADLRIDVRQPDGNECERGDAGGAGAGGDDVCVGDGWWGAGGWAGAVERGCAGAGGGGTAAAGGAGQCAGGVGQSGGGDSGAEGDGDAAQSGADQCGGDGVEQRGDCAGDRRLAGPGASWAVGAVRGDAD